MTGTVLGGRPPRSEEWEAAARGSTGRTYPWGDEFDQRKCNGYATRLDHAADVRCYTTGDSVNGARQMAGNVFEWVLEDDEKRGLRRKRGGSFDCEVSVYGMAFFEMQTNEVHSGDTGFRILREA
ncbi:MAG: formylglycine-generating enzyme family protein [Planctomycetota bacterium]|jgi:formylglycine-generating enzyme required for sulfatase activity